jgi:hypothetical protein
MANILVERLQIKGNNMLSSIPKILDDMTEIVFFMGRYILRIHNKRFEYYCDSIFYRDKNSNVFFYGKAIARGIPPS